MLLFLAGLFNSGVGFSAINSARSALSAILQPIEGRTVGEHPLVSRLMKGIKSTRPPLPRYKHTWDPTIVLNHLRRGSDNLKDKTLHLTMLLALISGQRAQTLHSLKISDMTTSDSEVTFTISSALKTRAPGAILRFSKFEEENLCLVTQINQYITLTRGVRQDDRLLISFVKPHREVGCDTVRRWILILMKEAGVDTTKFKAHSTRSAASSAALRNKVPIAAIMRAGMWRNENTFAKFYNRPIDSVDNDFARGVLGLAGDMA